MLEPLKLRPTASEPLFFSRKHGLGTWSLLFGGRWCYLFSIFGGHPAPKLQTTGDIRQSKYPGGVIANFLGIMIIHSRETVEKPVGNDEMGEPGIRMAHTPKSSILIGFSIINHPAIGVSPIWLLSKLWMLSKISSPRDGRSSRCNVARHWVSLGLVGSGTSG